MSIALTCYDSAYTSLAILTSSTILSAGHTRWRHNLINDCITAVALSNLPSCNCVKRLQWPFVEADRLAKPSGPEGVSCHLQVKENVTQAPISALRVYLAWSLAISFMPHSAKADSGPRVAPREQRPLYVQRSMLLGSMRSPCSVTMSLTMRDSRAHRRRVCSRMRLYPVRTCSSSTG